MTASPNIKTPAMDVPLLPLPSAHDKGEQLKKQFTRVCLSEVPPHFAMWGCSSVLLWGVVDFES